VLRVPSGNGEAELDAIVVEEPLEIRVNGETVAVTMRTPGADLELAIGFLFAEGILAKREGQGAGGWGLGKGFRLRSSGNVMDVRGEALDRERLEGARRGTLTTAACGVCGRKGIGDLVSRLGRLGASAPIAARIVADAPKRLRAAQKTFDQTGGLHGAALLDAKGKILASAEDVGRHNAVDKAVGAMLCLRKRPALLVVSGRLGFEIVQKAAAAGVPVVAGVSAPSSLAIDLADAAGIALAGFVRDGGFNLYTHAGRIQT
jgi:FdhD protein